MLVTARLAPTTLALALAFASEPASAQTLESRGLSLEGARTVAAAAEAEARQNGWTVAIAIVDPSGGLISFHRLDGVQSASLDLAIGKARTAARFRRPTKALADAIAEGRSGLLGVEGLVALEGGLPIVLHDEVVGAIGVSGMSGEQDAVVARAGVAALGQAPDAGS